MKGEFDKLLVVTFLLLCLMNVTILLRDYCIITMFCFIQKKRDTRDIYLFYLLVEYESV